MAPIANPSRLGSTEPQLTVEQLGPLRVCNGCGEMTYDPANLPETPTLLPDGFTVGHARHRLWVKGILLLVCANCRYGKFARY